MLRRESKKTFEHLLFICRGTCLTQRILSSWRKQSFWKLAGKTQIATLQLWSKIPDSGPSGILSPYAERKSTYLLHWKAVWTFERQEVDLKSQRGASVARKALMFGKMLKYKGVILECGASGLTVGELGSHRKQRECVRKEDGENITTLTKS